MPARGARECRLTDRRSSRTKRLRPAPVPASKPNASSWPRTVRRQTIQASPSQNARTRPRRPTSRWSSFGSRIPGGMCTCTGSEQTRANPPGGASSDALNTCPPAQQTRHGQTYTAPPSERISLIADSSATTFTTHSLRLSRRFPTGRSLIDSPRSPRRLTHDGARADRRRLPGARQPTIGLATGRRSDSPIRRLEELARGGCGSVVPPITFVQTWPIERTH